MELWDNSSAVLLYNSNFNAKKIKVSNALISEVSSLQNVNTGRARLIRTWLIQSFTLFEVSVKYFPIISCLKRMVNSCFHLFPRKSLPKNDFELTVPNLYRKKSHNSLTIVLAFPYLDLIF